MAVKRDYTLTGINCANCARKIESGIRELDGISNANLNFSLSRLSIEMPENASIAHTEAKIQRIMDKIENGSKLTAIKEEDSDDASAETEKQSGPAGHIRVLLYITGALSYLAAFFLVDDPAVKLLLYIATYGIFGTSVLLKSFRNILKGQIFDENFLMSIASIGAFLIGEHPEGAAVMMFYQIGELFQDYAVDHSRRSIKSLLNIKPDYANLKTQDGYKRVNPSHVMLGDLIIVRPGERVPLDGTVLEGISSLDTSALTGESLPREVSEGSEVLSGCINQTGVLTVRVTRTFGNSTVSRILELVENASQKKAVTERFITRFAAWYTPAVVGLAVLLAVVPPVLGAGKFSEWLYRALVFLVLSCPCALVVSIPLGFFGGIGAASKKGILVKGGNYLEALAKAGTVVFDKTGTLTMGEFEVTEVSSAAGMSREDILYYMAHAEAYSTHPLAQSVIKTYGNEPDKTLISDYREFAGRGVSASISGRKVLCGNLKLFQQSGIEMNQPRKAGTMIYLAVDGQDAGFVRLEDTLKKDAPGAIKSLRDLKVENIVMLTGDQKDAAQSIAERLGIEAHAELLPDQKVDQLESIMKDKKGKGTVIFVGDGINDAPVIARADVGVAMGGTGSDAAIEAADIVMMTDEPRKLAEAITIARKTRTVVFQNILLAVFVKVLVLALGAGGIATLWEAVFADVGVALLAVLNAMRLTRVNRTGSLS